jgi:DNA-binding MarR family transcriptional regulator
VQAITSPTAGTSTALAHDLFAVVAYLLKSSTPDVFRAMGELELSMTQCKLLWVLEDADEELALKELGDRLGLSLPATSRAIDGLHQRGYVERRENERDRRMKGVRINEAGRDVLRRLGELRLARLEQFAATMSEAERRRLAAALSPLVARDEIAACRREGLGARD